jgi:hypothetical protein
VRSEIEAVPRVMRDPRWTGYVVGADGASVGAAVLVGLPGVAEGDRDHAVGLDLDRLSLAVADVPLRPLQAPCEDDLVALDEVQGRPFADARPDRDVEELRAVDPLAGDVLGAVVVGDAYLAQRGAVAEVYQFGVAGEVR